MKLKLLGFMDFHVWSVQKVMYTRHIIGHDGAVLSKYQNTQKLQSTWNITPCLLRILNIGGRGMLSNQQYEMKCLGTVSGKLCLNVKHKTKGMEM